MILGRVRVPVLVALLAALTTALGACGSTEQQSSATAPSSAATASSSAATPSTDLGGTGTASTETASTDSAPGASQPTVAGGASSTSMRPVPSIATGSSVTSTVDPALHAIVDLATADLAARLEIDPSSITVASAVVMEWPNGALGCPEPGRSYTQVVSEGARVVLVAGSGRYDYHVGQSGSPFLCERTSTSGIGTDPSTPTTTG